MILFNKLNDFRTLYLQIEHLVDNTNYNYTTSVVFLIVVVNISFTFDAGQIQYETFS